VPSKVNPALARRATISDVAASAGVSRTTVSLVLADHPRITGQTKDRVRQAMAELGYVYNRAATAVRHGRSTLIGLLVTDIRNPFFAEVTMAVDQAVEAHDTSAILGFSFGSPEREAQICLSLVEHLIGGLILLPTARSTAAGLACLAGPSPLALVQMLRQVPGLPSDFVGVDNIASGRLLGDHLAGLGVRRTVLVGGGRGSTQFDERLAGLAQGLSGGSVAPVQDGAAGLAAALDAGGIDSVVTYNDTHLLSVMNALRDRGLEPGVNIALASFDNTSLSAELKPAVTSVDHHAGLLAGHAVELLVARAEEPGRDWQHITVPGTLVTRDSTHA
jgi:LacI family transcriptional regulator